MSDIHLHIDELVLDGFDRADRHRIAEAVQVQLGRLLRERGLAAGGADRDQVDAGQFVLPAAASARAIGGHVAKQVHGALSHGR